MTLVKEYETVDDELLKFAVTIAKYQGRFIFCKHRERETLELPGRTSHPLDLSGDPASPDRLCRKKRILLTRWRKQIFPALILGGGRDFYTQTFRIRGCKPPDNSP